MPTFRTFILALFGSLLLACSTPSRVTPTGETAPEASGNDRINLAGIVIGKPLPDDLPTEVEYLGMTWQVGVATCGENAFSVSLLRSDQAQLDAVRLESAGLLPGDNSGVHVTLGETGKLPPLESGTEGGSSASRRMARHVRDLRPADSGLALTQVSADPCYAEITGFGDPPLGESVYACYLRVGSRGSPTCRFANGGVFTLMVVPGVEYEVYLKHRITNNRGVSNSEKRAYPVTLVDGKLQSVVGQVGTPVELRMGAFRTADRWPVFAVEQE